MAEQITALRRLVRCLRRHDPCTLTHAQLQTMLLEFHVESGIAIPSPPPGSGSPGALQVALGHLCAAAAGTATRLQLGQANPYRPIDLLAARWNAEAGVDAEHLECLCAIDLRTGHIRCLGWHCTHCGGRIAAEVAHRCHTSGTARGIAKSATTGPRRDEDDAHA